METYGGRVKVCGRGGGVWWEGWRCVGGVEVSAGWVEMCGKERGVWEGWRCVGRSEVCGKDGDVFNFKNSCN